MKRALILVISLSFLLVLSTMAWEGAERIKRKFLDEHENRVQIVKKWTGPSALREKSEVLLPEIEGSKGEMGERIVKDNLRNVVGVEKTRFKSSNMEVQKIEIYHPAFEMERIKALQNSVRNEISKSENKNKVEELKNEFYLDFLELKLENAKVAGNEDEIYEIESAIQNFKKYLNDQKESKE